MGSLEEVKKLLRSLLVSAPVKVTVQSLARDFYDLEGYQIPYKELGYNSLIHLLHSIPDVLLVNGTSNFSEVTLIVSEKTAHVSELVMKQRKPANRKNAPKKSVTRRSYPNMQRNCQTTSKPTYRISTGPIQPQSQMPKIPQQLYSNPCSLSPFPRPILPILKTRPQLVNRVKAPPSTPDVLNGTHSPVNDSPEPLKVDYIHTRLAKLKLRKFKQNTFDIDSKLNVTVSLRDDASVSIDDNSKIPVRLQENLRTLISRHPHGIWCTDLDAEYQLIYKQRIEYEKYGFLSLVNLCLTLEDIFTCRKESSFDYKLYDKHKPIPNIRTITKEKFPIETINVDPFSLPPVEPTPDWVDRTDLILENTVKLCETVENHIVDQFQINRDTPIVISEISSPDCFWMYKDDGLLNDMMNNMQHFYSENKAKYLIPEILHEVGLYCVVYLLSEYQRGIITEILPNMGHVKVYALDFGTLVNIPRNKVWFLNREFSTLGCQAVKAKLADIEPIDGTWCQESSKCFRDLIKGKQLVARVAEKGNDKLTVYLADTRTPHKSISDVLVDRGFAKYTNKGNTIVDHNAATDKKKGLSRLLERVKLRKQLNNTNSCL